MKKTDISIIICTHNRAHLLRKILPVYEELSRSHAFELVVVPNGCTDETAEVLKDYQRRIPSLVIAKEDRIGHCHARNKGWQTAQSRWVIYIDDDAYPAEQFFEQVNRTLQQEGIKAFSGHARFWQDDSPRWIEANFVEVPLFSRQLRALPEGAHINGCVCGFERETLSELGGFDPAYGMRGNKVGYADEVDVQFRMQAKGYPIFYNPDLQVMHRSHFDSPAGFIASAYSKGRYSQRLQAHAKWKHLIKLVFQSLKSLIIFVPTVLLSGWQRAQVKLWSKPAYHMGRLIG